MLKRLFPFLLVAIILSIAYIIFIFWAVDFNKTNTKGIVFGYSFLMLVCFGFFMASEQPKK